MDLESKFGRKYKVFVDDAYRAETTQNKSADKWRYLELRGKYGYVYPFSSSHIAVAVTGPKIATKLLKRPGWKVLQNADDAIVFMIPDEDTSFAFSTLKLFRKKVLSEEDRAKKAAVLAKAREAKKAAGK